MNNKRKKKKLYILGAGGLGREVLWHIEDNTTLLEEYELVGFLDDLNPEKRVVNRLEILGDLNLIIDTQEEIGVIIAIGDRYVRKEKHEILKKNKKILFPNMIVEGIKVSDNVKIGQGNIIFDNVKITTNIEIGDFNLIYLNSILTHDVKFGNYISMYSGVILSGGVIMDDFCEVGTGAIVIPRVHVKPHTIIGAGATVIKDTEGNETIVGVPAKKINKNK